MIFRSFFCLFCVMLVSYANDITIVVENVFLKRTALWFSWDFVVVICLGGGVGWIDEGGWVL